jgi:Glycosyl hydrolase-like 10
MRSILFLLTNCAFAATFSYQIGGDPGAWPAILSSIGLTPGPGGVVVQLNESAPSDWAARVEAGTILILEGDSPLAASFGFRAGRQRVSVRGVEDVHAPKLRIVWEKPLDVPVFEIPKDARVFSRERGQGAPLMAGVRRGGGAVLWVAVSPGSHGYERFPYLPQALLDLGLTPPFRSTGLWAFFDSSYRTRVDLDYFAAKWRAAGISTLHVAAWHFWERNPEGDEYLRHLIEACHRNAILVYAWFELPHVSDKFWDQHPEWREKTALGQDAQLDWRKLMNLAHPQTFDAAAEGVRDLVNRFDWDGMNLAELYFESLEGHDNPARLTPMNDDVRAEFQKKAGFDPKELFDHASPRYLSKNTAGLKQFLDYRADLTRRMQAAWIAQAEQIRKTKPYLDLTLTHVDDRFDTSMRDKIGADVSAVLPLLSDHDFTFLIEDPATIWNLGPQRYPEIAGRYRPLTPRQDKLAIDINVVERYQDVYPTKQPTGAELFQLVHQGALSFPHVALYFENSISSVDLPLLAAAGSTVEHAEQSGAKLMIQTREGGGVLFKGPALVDGKPWPVANDATVWLPGGTHSVEPASKPLGLRVTGFNGELKSASVTPSGVEFAYRSSARALATVDRVPRRVEIDGAEVPIKMEGNVVFLSRGQHLVVLTAPP